MEFLGLLLKLIYLLVPAAFANMAPALAKPFLSRLALSPIDSGLQFRGKPIFGTHKTWGGTLFGILAGLLGGYLQYVFYPWLKPISLLDYSNWGVIGLLLGAGAMVGDLVKSFFKRQFEIKPGQAWIPFDELDFVIGAILFLAPVYFPGWLNVLLILAVAFLGHILINLLGYYLRIRRKSEVVSLKYQAFTDELQKKEGRLIAGTLLILCSIYVNGKFGSDFLKNALFLLTLLHFALDYLRAGLMIGIPFYARLGKIKFERDVIHPATFALLGLVLSLQIAEVNLVLAAFAMFVYGDTAAAVFGRGFGKIKLFRRKTLEGSLAMLVFSMIAGAFFIKSFALLFALAAAATTIELFLLRIPDALILPLVIAVIGKILEGRMGK